MLRYIIGNDMVYLKRNARSSVTGAAIPENATGGLTVRDLDGAEVGGQSWPAAFAWDANLKGFAGTLLGSLDVEDLALYELVVELDGGPNLTYGIVEPMRAYEDG